MVSLKRITHARALGVLAVLTLLGAATTAAWASAPVERGQIVFRRYLDAGRTTGALFTIRPDGTGVRQVTRPRRGVIDQYPDWSPDGRRLVFHRMVPCTPGESRDGMDGTCDLIYTVRLDGKGLKPLVPCAFDASRPYPDSCVGAHTPAWSSDGSKIAFSYSLVNRDYVGSLKLQRAIWIVNADGTDRRQLTQLTPGTSWDAGPQWSPDGSKIVFTRADLAKQKDAVLTVDVESGELFQVTPWPLHADGDPEWSRDGNWILLTTQPRNRAENVYKIRPDGTGLTNLTRHKRGRYHYLSSSFSPDGKRIVSARTPGTGPERAADLVVMNADGSKIRPITKTRLWESSVDWGPGR
jgi:Tol biopolymer transport system component